MPPGRQHHGDGEVPEPVGQAVGGGRVEGVTGQLAGGPQRHEPGVGAFGIDEQLDGHQGQQREGTLEFPDDHQAHHRTQRRPDEHGHDQQQHTVHTRGRSSRVRTTTPK